MSEKFWAIKGNVGFYTGTSLTRNDAIAEHVSSFDSWLHERRTPAAGNALSARQKSAWDDCKRRGDRAVKVIVSEDQS